MKGSDLVFFIFFGVVAAFVISVLLRDRLTKKRAVTALASRLQHSDEQFAHAYFRDPKRADIAMRTRRVLSKNLEIPLEGLTPNDRLNDDLGAELQMNPHFFWDLEAEFGIKTGVEDFEAFEKTVERLVTFKDLVEYVERKMSEPPAEKSSEDEGEKPSRAYEFGMRSIPVLCIGGLVIAVVGIFAQKRTAMNVGGLIFLSGVAVWGFANGGELVRGVIQNIRGTSLKEIAARPWPLILLTFAALFFLWVGWTLSWAILKNVLSPNNGS